MKYHSCAVKYGHRTPFKEKFLKHIPDLTEQEIGIDVIFTLKPRCEGANF